MMKMSAIVTAISLATLPSVSNVASAATPTGVTFIGNLAYGAMELQKLDLYRPSPTFSGPRPVILTIHGGYFKYGDKSNFLPTFTQKLNAAGYAVAALNYRLNTHGGVSITDMVNDVQLAVRWLRVNAVRYGIDPTRFCTDGYSAGGTLAVAAGALTAIYPGDMAKQYAATPVAVQCVLDNSGPTGSKLTGGTVLGLVSSKSAPMMITHGLQDNIVPISNSYNLAAALKADGVYNQHIYYTGGHVFEGITRDALNNIQSQQIIFFNAMLGQ